MTPEKVVILYSVPRSGSTYVEKAIETYLQHNWGHQGLSEFFNVNLPIDLTPEKVVVRTDIWKESTYRFTLSAQQLNDDILRRREFLERNPHQSFFLKILEPQLAPEILVEQFSRSTVIFCRRRNIWQHLLSFLISFTTGQFYPQGGVKWEPGSIHAQFRTFAFFWLSMTTYLTHRKQHPNSIEITYEDLLAERGPYMASLGFDKEFDWDAVQYPHQENHRNKELAFSNLDEIKSWYVSSTLNRLYPITAPER